jgi:hypothetical protein
VIGLVEKGQKERKKAGLIAIHVVKIKKLAEKLVNHVVDLLEKKDQNIHHVDQRLVLVAKKENTAKNQKPAKKDNHNESYK